MPVAQPASLMPEPSWDLRIFVPNLQLERTLRVKGDMHVGGIMLKLVEDIYINDIDWSDYALWWPKRNCWLDKTRQTLNHYGVQADSYLTFTPMHKPLKVQLPDLRYIDANVNFSADCFTAIKLLCKELGIRHSEELSFFKPLSREHLKKNYTNVGVTPKQRTFSQDACKVSSGTKSLNGSIMRSSSKNSHTSHSKLGTYVPGSQTASIDTRSLTPDITSTLSRHASYRGFSTTYCTTMLVDNLNYLEISNSNSHVPSIEAKNSLLYPKNLIQKARLNSGWLDSHLSLYQQNVRQYDTLLLRFKYNEFYDLNPKLDVARINQIYEQARWSLSSGEIECSKDKMKTLTSLQYQIQQQIDNPMPKDFINYTNDDVDAALTELQLQLEGVATTLIDRTSYNTPTNTNNRHLSATECKLDYIKAWRTLPDYGIHMFVVKFDGSSREEILGIASDRLIKIDPRNGKHLKVWPYSSMKTWVVNWDIRKVFVDSEDGQVSFTCLSADCKIVHEFIGGYIFLSMRSKDNSQIFNEKLFYKLTKGWTE